MKQLPRTGSFFSDLSEVVQKIEIFPVSQVAGFTFMIISLFLEKDIPVGCFMIESSDQVIQVMDEIKEIKRKNE